MSEELLDALQGLTVADQRRVIEFARSLAASRPQSTAGADLARFAGTIEKGDLAAMSAAIEKGCEQVDSDACEFR